MMFRYLRVSPVFVPVLLFLACKNQGAPVDGAKSQSLNTTTGQILGTLGSGEKVCLHKFEGGKYKVSTPSGTECGNNPRYVEKSEVTIGADAFKPWLEEVPAGGMIKFDMRYAGAKIFPKGNGTYRINEPLYGKGRCFLHPKAASALYRAEKLLRETAPEFRLLVLDCYRPQYVSALMWDLVPLGQFVAASGKSSHNKGGAVDLTLARMEGTTPVPVDMGSEFDLFDDAKSGYPGAVGEGARKNRALLRRIMTDLNVGFNPYDGEWWHFSTPANEEYLDLPL